MKSPFGGIPGATPVLAPINAEGGWPSGTGSGNISSGTAGEIGANARDPVWDVYDRQRTVRLRLKYFSELLHRLQRYHTWTETTIAITSGSGLAALGLQFFSTRIGSVVWQSLLIFSALVSSAKPFLRFTQKIQLLEELVTGYSIADHDLDKLTIAIRQKGKYDSKRQNEFAAILQKMDGLVAKSSAFPVDRRLKDQCQEEVNKELSESSFLDSVSTPND